MNPLSPKAGWPQLEGLLAGQRFAVLATQGDEAPYTSLVCFAATEDLRRLLFPTRSGTRKFAHLMACAHVALLIDNRSNDARDYREAVAVTALGTASLEPRGGEVAEHRALLRDRHPDLGGFLAEPDCRIAVVSVREYRLVARFEQVTLLDPSRRAEPR